MWLNLRWPKHKVELFLQSQSNTANTTQPIATRIIKHSQYRMLIFYQSVTACVRNGVLACYRSSIYCILSTICINSRWNDSQYSTRNTFQTLISCTVTLRSDVAYKQLIMTILYFKINQSGKIMSQEKKRDGNGRSSCVYCIMGYVILRCVCLGKCSRSSGYPMHTVHSVHTAEIVRVAC